ncbi:MAG: hypothetical protein KC466_11505 [Myxococcales bacterium]|nr:hypothetical protein [Myxococcales bacterium]
MPPIVGVAASANPQTPAAPPAHPYLAPQGRNGMHADSHNSGTYPWAGPLGVNPVIHSASLGFIGGQCATVTFDSQGRLMAVCADFGGIRLLLMDAITFAELARYELPPRESGGSILDIDEIMNDTSGGAYHHIDDQDRPIIATADRHIRIFEVVGAPGALAWQVVEDYDLNPSLPAGSRVTDAVPDFDGRIWFCTRGGVVGVVDPMSGAVSTLTLVGEEIQNTFAVAADGVYIVSDYALYRFEYDTGTEAPVFTWREAYDRGTSIKPGAINQGSGTTPTLLGDDLITIGDNADSQINLLVYKRRDDAVGPRLVCAEPLFAPGASWSDNSFIGYDRSIIVENNYGSGNALEPYAVTAPGVWRVDVRPDLTGCDVAWRSNEISPTTVPKMSVASGLIYLYTRMPGTDVGLQAWSLTALDYETGATRWSIFTGTGFWWNNNWSPITLGPNGAAYAGVLNGIVSVRDGS